MTKKWDSLIWGKKCAHYRQYGVMEKVNETLAVTRRSFSTETGNSFCWSTMHGLGLTENVKYIIKNNL